MPHSQVTLSNSSSFKGTEVSLHHAAPAPQSLQSIQESIKPLFKAYSNHMYTPS